MSAPAIPSLQRVPLPEEGLGGWLTTSLGTAVDSALVRAMSFVVERALIPGEDDIEALRRSAAPMLDPELQRAPERFFAFGPPASPLAVKTDFRRKLSGGVVVRHALKTGYEVFLPEDDEAEPLSQGDPVLFEHWMHEREPARGTVVALHGFTMGRPRLDAIAAPATASRR